MKPTEIDEFEKKFGYPPTQIRVAVDALAVYVNKDNPLEHLTMQQVDAVFSKTRSCGMAQGIDTWGSARVGGRLGESTAESLRPQLGLGHLRLFQGARAVQRRLPRHGEGTAGFRFGGAGRHRGPQRHRLQRHRLQDLGREDRSPSPRRRARPSCTADPELVLAGKYPLARFLYLYINQAPNRPLDPLVREFVRYVLRREGQEVVVKDGYLPVSAKIAAAEVTKVK